MKNNKHINLITVFKQYLEYSIFIDKKILKENPKYQKSIKKELKKSINSCKDVIDLILKPRLNTLNILKEL